RHRCGFGLRRSGTGHARHAWLERPRAKVRAALCRPSGGGSPCVSQVRARRSREELPRRRAYLRVKADAPPFPASPWLSERVRLALQEDLGSAGDVSSDAVFEAAARREAVVVAKANGVLCGAPLFSEVFRLLNADVRVDWAN